LTKIYHYIYFGIWIRQYF